MTTIAERLALLITADVDDAVRGLNKLEGNASRDIGKAQDSVDELGAKLTKIGAGMMAVGALGIAGLGRAAMATSDLNESIGQTEQIFGDAAGEIGSFAEGAAGAIGQSERAARDATSEFGLLLKNMGFAADETVSWSQDLTVLASDMASFKNTSPEEAVLALGAALRGESEPIRRYGVMLDDASVRQRAVEMGLAATTAEVDNHGKAQARLSIIMESTSDLQGDFARTSDGMANSQRSFNAQLENFQASLGQGILPVMETLLGKGTSLLEWFNDMDPATQKAVSSALTYGVALIGVAGATSMAVGQAIKMRDNLKKLTTAVSGNVAAIGAAAAVVVVAAMVYKRWADESQRAENRLQSMTTALQSHNSETEAVAAVVENARDEFDSFADAMDTGGISSEDMAAAVLEGGDALKEMTERLQAAALASGDTFQESEAVAKVTDRLATAYEGATVEIENMNRLTNAAGDEELPNLAAASADAEAMIAELDSAMDAAGDAADDFRDQYRDLVVEILGGLSAETEAALLIEDITAALDDMNDKSLAEIQGEVIDFVTELAEIEGAAHDAGVDISGMSDEATYGLLLLMTQAGMSKSAVDDVIAALDSFDGKSVNASLNLDTSQFSEAFRALPGYAAPTTSYAPPPIVVNSTTNVNLDGTQIAESVSESNLKAGILGPK